MKLTPHHSDSSWRFRWATRHGYSELAYVNERGVWLRRFRACDPDGTAGGWSSPLTVTLPAPEDEQDAERIAHAHASEDTP